jgi:hypothetical protein
MFGMRARVPNHDEYHASTCKNTKLRDRIRENH